MNERMNEWMGGQCLARELTKQDCISDGVFAFIFPFLSLFLPSL